jgi:hypothetical protein
MRFASVQAILEKFSISEATQRSADVTPALGEAVDRLLLLTVPLGETSDVSQLETVLGVIGKSGSQLSIRTVQHLFARVSSYPEAIAVFYAMRRKNVAMDMHAYHAMIYSLQRLEEESWAAKFANERLALHQASSSSLSSASQGEEGDRSFVSEQALDFIMNGVDNQLIPEQKPWLGRVLFADGEQQAAGRDSFDALGAQWVERYRQGDVAAVTRSASTRAKKRQQKQHAGVQK